MRPILKLKKSQKVTIVSKLLLVYLFGFFFFIHPAFSYLDKSVTSDRFHLSNGMSCILSNIPSSKLSSIQLWVKTGSINENPHLGSGLAHLVEHMIFKGTKTRPGDSIESEIKSLGGSINAFTSYDYTAYKIVVPSEHIEEALFVLDDIIFQSLFNAKDIHDEREVVLSEQRMRDDKPTSKLMRVLWEQAFRVHPYHFPIIGYTQILKKLTPENVIQWYSTKYVPNNMVLSIAGNFDNLTLKNVIKKIFEKHERKSILLYQLPQEPRQLGKKEFTKEYEGKLAHIAYAFKSTDIFHKDLYALDVLAAMLGQGRNAVFEERLRIKKELVYSAKSFNYTPKYPGLFICVFTLDPKNIKSFSSEFVAIIGDIKKGRFDVGNLAIAKKKITTDIALSQITVNDIATDVASNEIITGNYQFTNRYVRGLKDVSKNDVIRVAKKYLISDMLTVVNFLPKSYVSCLKKETKDVAVYDPIKIHLNNNLRLVLQKRDQLPLVSIRILFRGGLLSENAQNNGISHLTSQLLLKGSKQYNRERIDKLVDQLGGHISSQSGNNSFYLSADVTKSDITQTIALLKDSLFHPLFLDDAVEREKRNLLAAIDMKENDIFYVGVRDFKKLLFQEHPYSLNLLGTRDSVKSITRDQIKDYYYSRLNPEEMVISIVGDFDEKKMLAMIQSAFGMFVNKTSSSQYPKRESSFPKESIVSEKDMDKRQTLILKGFPGISLYNKDRFVVDIISSVLSGGSGRVYQEIREKYGASYTLGFTSFLGIDPGFLTFYVATTNDNISLVTNELKNIITSLKKEGISEEELESSKREQISSFRAMRETNQGIALDSGINELYGLGYEYSKYYEQNINKVTNDDVIRVINDFFKEDQSVSLVIKSLEEDNE